MKYKSKYKKALEDVFYSFLLALLLLAIFYVISNP